MPQPADTFLDMPSGCDYLADAAYAVLPIPYDQTVTYRTGAAAGPTAILNASTQIELFDEELGGEYHQAGIGTHPPIPPADGPAEQFQRVQVAARPLLEAGKFLLCLGGEHSLTIALVEAAAAVCGPISVLQIDAHADLRDSYDGLKLSNACVMRRVLETTNSICQVGIRSYCAEEHEQCRKQAEKFITPARIAEDPLWIDKVLAMLDRKVYVTLDMDGLDPSIAPGVGTPEPGGLTWAQTTALLRRVCDERTVVAADIMEVRPLGENHITEFLAARLGYKIIAYTQPGSIAPGR